MMLGVNSHTGGSIEDNVVSPVTAHMDAYLQSCLKDRDYGGGIDTFLIVPVVVFSDEQENADYAKPSHKVQRSKDYYGDKGWIKSIVFALPFNPELVAQMSLEEFRITLCNAVLEKLESPDMKILKAFDYAGFKKDASDIISEYKHQHTLENIAYVRYFYRYLSTQKTGFLK